MKKYILIPIFCLMFFPLQAQLQLAGDSLTLNDLYSLIWAYHPVVKQADLQVGMADAQFRQARGQFDPKLEMGWDKKSFDKKEYINNWYTTLKLPTWIPLDPKVSLYRNRGEFLNPESSIPETNDFKQLSVGIDVPLGQGLITDARRNAFRQAQVYLDMADTERQQLLNDIFFKASKDYWEWFAAYHIRQMLLQGVEVAQEIFDRTKLNFTFGEASAMDTVQASIILQSRQMELRESIMELRVAELNLSNHLWSDTQDPLAVSDEIMPVSMSYADRLGHQPFGSSDTLVSQLMETNPTLSMIEYQLVQLELDQRLNREYLKPKINFNYNLLDQPLTGTGDWQGIDFQENYKLGLHFSWPLGLRTARGKLAETNLKIESTQWKFQLEKQKIKNTLLAFLNRLEQLQQMLDQQEAIVNSYSRLLQAERDNMDLGESDLFKINFIQEKLIESQTKYVKLEAVFEKEKAGISWLLSTWPDQ